MLKETIVNSEFIERMDAYRQPDKSKGLIENCSNSVVIFSEYMRGIRLYSWQIAFLNEIQQGIEPKFWTKEFLGLTSRQIGKSTAMAIFILWATVFNKYPGEPTGTGNNTKACVISASDTQAKKLLGEIKKLIRIGDANMKKYDYDKFFSNLIDDKEPNNMAIITFKAYKPDVHGLLLKDSKLGSVIKSYPPTSVVLGESFTILIEDEAGKSDKISDQFHYEYASPTGDAHNAIKIYLSTPWTLSGFFYRMADPDDTMEEHNFVRLLFTDKAIEFENPQQYKVIQDKKKKLIIEGKKDEVDRAYHCKFVKGETTYFNPDKTRRIFEDYSMVESYDGECDIGVDFGGQTTSRTVVTVSKVDSNGTIWRLYHRTYSVGSDTHLLDDLIILRKHFNFCQRIIVDDCPQGDYLIRQMEEKGWSIVRMNFRRDKVKKYGAFRAKVNRELVRSYRDDELKVEMNAFEVTETASNTVLKHATGYTDDMIDSFVMSCYFFVEEDNGIRYWDLDGDF